MAKGKGKQKGGGGEGPKQKGGKKKGKAESDGGEEEEKGGGKAGGKSILLECVNNIEGRTPAEQYLYLKFGDPDALREVQALQDPIPSSSDHAPIMQARSPGVHRTRAGADEQLASHTSPTRASYQQSAQRRDRRASIIPDAGMLAALTSAMAPQRHLLKAKPVGFEEGSRVERRLNTCMRSLVHFDRVSGVWTEEYELDDDGMLTLDWAVRGVSRVGRVYQGAKQIYGPVTRTCDFEWTQSPPNSPRRLRTAKGDRDIERYKALGGRQFDEDERHDDALPFRRADPFHNLQRITVDPMVRQKERSPRKKKPLKGQREMHSKNSVLRKVARGVMGQDMGAFLPLKEMARGLKRIDTDGRMMVHKFVGAKVNRFREERAQRRFKGYIHPITGEIIPLPEDIEEEKRSASGESDEEGGAGRGVRKDAAKPGSAAEEPEPPSFAELFGMRGSMSISGLSTGSKWSKVKATAHATALGAEGGGGRRPGAARLEEILNAMAVGHVREEGGEGEGGSLPQGAGPRLARGPSVARFSAQDGKTSDSFGLMGNSFARLMASATLRTAPELAEIPAPRRMPSMRFSGDDVQLLKKGGTFGKSRVRFSDRAPSPPPDGPELRGEAVGKARRLLPPIT